nr:DoxX family membrane protein [Haliscomenobacter sp.]
MNSFFSTTQFYRENILAILRIIIGLLLIYHGYEVFDATTMKGYLEWDDFKSPLGAFLVYAGKGAEFVAGVLLTLGFLTWWGADLYWNTSLHHLFCRAWQVLV